MGDFGEATGESGSAAEKVGVVDSRRRSDGFERMCEAMSSGETVGCEPPGGGGDEVEG